MRSKGLSNNIAGRRTSCDCSKYWFLFVTMLITGAYLFFIFEPPGGFDPPMAQTKALVGVITEVRCSIVANMSTKSSKKHLGSILVNIKVTIIYTIDPMP